MSDLCYLNLVACLLNRIVKAHFRCEIAGFGRKFSLQEACHS